MPLDPQFIEVLLNREADKKKSGLPPGAHPRPVQVGPLRRAEKAEPCASRGCRCPTFLRINGVPYCDYPHALQVLNKIIMDYQGINLSDCDCDSGRLSRGNIHYPTCALYESLKNPTVVDPDKVDLNNLL